MPGKAGYGKHYKNSGNSHKKSKSKRSGNSSAASAYRRATSSTKA